MGCCQCQGIETMFDKKTAERELKRYQKKGPTKTTGMLLDAIPVSYTHLTLPTICSV